MPRALVLGLGVTGQAVVASLLRRGWEVEVSDDRPTEASRAEARRLGVEYHERPDATRLADRARAAELTVVSPGIPISHPIFSLRDVEVVSEIELASRWTQVPLVAVTGTNGKTTVVTLVAEMLRESGLEALAVGNIGFTLVEALDRPADVLVTEVSSFQLQMTSTFHPAVAAWLNLAQDHLDWHPNMEHYALAKARIWANQTPADTTVVNAEDPAVTASARDHGHGTRARIVSFGLGTGDFTVAEGALRTPGGAVIALLEDLPRRLPHDVANGLAACAVASAAGASLEACSSVLRRFRGLPHRVSHVGEWGGISFYDDSKATTPASVLAALSGFDSVVLLAGGKNKGLDFGILRDAVGHVRAVVAMGAAAGEVEAAFAGVRPVRTASTMEEAVVAALEMARPGDAVLLSPGGASYDWYRSYVERGEDFVRAVKHLTEGAPR